MNVNFVLIASGNVTMGRINHAIFAGNEAEARKDAEKAVAALYRAGYFQFTLYDTSRPNGRADVEIARFRVEENEPTILMN